MIELYTHDDRQIGHMYLPQQSQIYALLRSRSITWVSAQNF